MKTQMLAIATLLLSTLSTAAASENDLQFDPVAILEEIENQPMNTQNRTKKFVWDISDEKRP